MATATTTPVESTVRPRPVYTRIAVFGLLIVTVSLSIVWAAVGFDPEALVFIGPFIVLPAVIAGLAWRFGTWSKVLAAVMGLALLGLNSPFIVPVLGRPHVFFDFVPTVGAVVGALLALIGGTAAVIKRRDLRTEASTGERRVQLSSLAVIALLAVVSGLLGATSRTTATAADRSGAIEVTQEAFEFDSETYTASAGESTRFVVHNSDRVWHTFTIDGIVDQGVNPGNDAVFELSGLEAGTYTVYCKPHSEKNEAGEWEGMTATLEVE